MDTVRGVVVVLVLFVAFVGLLLGPLVPAVGYPESEAVPPGTGTATVEVVSVPATVALERTRFGAGTYRLTGSAVVTVEGVRGNPELTYALDVPAMGVSTVEHYPLAGRDGRLRLEPLPIELSPERVERERYDGTVGVWLRSEGGEYAAVVQRRVTVEVRDG